MGEGAYKGLFSLISLLGLVLMGWAYVQGRSGPGAMEAYYATSPGMRHATLTLALLGFIAIAASHGKGYLKLWLRNPMSIGLALWAIGHLMSNGEKIQVRIFTAILAVALLDIVMSTLRGKRPGHQPVVRSDILAVVAGALVYLVLLYGFHPYILNVPVL
jgi:uncharacterized membrane protein